MKKRILAIAANSKFSHSSLALRYFRENSKCDIFECSINDNIFDVYSHLCELPYEIMCFSVYIWNVEFVLKLLPMLKNARPDVKVILGGPEAGYNYIELLEKYYFIDGIIYGEGENALLAVAEGKSESEIPNYIYRNNVEIVCNEVKKVDLVKIKFPYTYDDLNELKNKIVYFESSRGCLFNCSYCLSSSEGKTRYFDMEYVKKGINFFIDNSVPLVKFVDRTFNENNERACEILNFIAQNNKGTKFHFEVSPILLTKEFKEILEKTNGLVQLEMGIQTTNIDAMKCINRMYDIKKVKENLDLFPPNVHIHLDLIAGLPMETLQTFRDGFNYVYALTPDMLQLGFLKLLHNTRLKKDAQKYGIVTTNFPPYEVLSTDTMSVEDIMLLKKIENAVDKYYNSGVFCKTIKALAQEPFEIFKNIGLELYRREKNGPLSRTALYELLYDLYGEKIKVQLANDFVVNNPNLKIPDILLSESDKNENLNYYREKILKYDDYKNIKFRLVSAGGEIFIISGKNKVESYVEFCKRH